MSCYTPEQRREIMARAHATLAELVPAAQREATASRMSGPGLVYKTRVADNDDSSGPRIAHKTRVADDDSSPVERTLPARRTSAKSAASEMAWWEWVDARIDYHLDSLTEATRQVLGQFRAQAREHSEREVGIVKRELELLARRLPKSSTEPGTYGFGETRVATLALLIFTTLSG